MNFLTPEKFAEKFIELEYVLSDENIPENIKEEYFRIFGWNYEKLKEFKMDLEKRMKIRALAQELNKVIEKSFEYSHKEYSQKLLEAEHNLLKECQEWDTEKYIILDREKLINRMGDLVISACEFGLQGQPFYAKEQEEAVKREIAEIIKKVNRE